MDKVRRLIRRSPSYEAIDGRHSDDDLEQVAVNGASGFSWIAYSIFLLIGVAMLWAWNMFLAAGPYFQSRFQSNEFILANFQSAEISGSTLMSLSSMLVLAKLQSNANYPKRIIASLIINIIGFTVLALSTKIALGVSPSVYFGFLIILVIISSLATGLIQNGSFAYVSGFGRPEYMQAIMFGQAISGVLPPLVQMVSVISSESSTIGDHQPSRSPFVYFLTATGVAAITLVAFLYLIVNHRPRPLKTAMSFVSDTREGEIHDVPNLDALPTGYKSVSMTYLARRLRYPASALFITFAVTMIFPVYTQKIVSTSESRSPFLQKAAFIPLAFLVWNTGDLIGRLVPLAPFMSLAHRPKILVILGICRLIFIPLYLLCNIQHLNVPLTTNAYNSDNINNRMNTFRHGELGVTSSSIAPDAFYLFLVQLPFGFTNGYLGSCCMMGSSSHVEEEEREAAGGFMGLVLVAGLAGGSLCSFLIAS